MSARLGHELIIRASFGPCMAGPRLGATTKDMPEHIRGGATLARDGPAGPLRGGPPLHRGGVAKGLKWLTLRRLRLLASMKTRARQSRVDYEFMT